jgi:hypothetical protein
VTRFIIPGLILAFSIYCLIDVVRSESSEVRGLPKLVWVLLVLVFPLAGGIAWFVAGRPRGTTPLGVDRLARPKTGPVVLGPDDDPDFLRSINRVDPTKPVTTRRLDPPDPVGTTGPVTPPEAVTPAEPVTPLGPADAAGGGTADPDDRGAQAGPSEPSETDDHDDPGAGDRRP